MEGSEGNITSLYRIISLVCIEYHELIQRIGLLDQQIICIELLRIVKVQWSSSALYQPLWYEHNIIWLEIWTCYILTCRIDKIIFREVFNISLVLLWRSWLKQFVTSNLSSMDHCWNEVSFSCRTIICSGKYNLFIYLILQYRISCYSL